MKKFILYSITIGDFEKGKLDPDVYQTTITSTDYLGALKAYQGQHGRDWVLLGIEEFGGWHTSFEANLAHVRALGVKFPFDRVVLLGNGSRIVNGILEVPKSVGPRKPPPALPLEVWHTREFDPDEAMAAMRLLCKGA